MLHIANFGKYSLISFSFKMIKVTTENTLTRKDSTGKAGTPRVMVCPVDRLIWIALTSFWDETDLTVTATTEIAWTATASV